MRDHEEDNRPAGLRTFGLIGLSGGVAALLGRDFPALPALGLGVTLTVMLASYWHRSASGYFRGVTTIFAAFIAYGCGALSVMGFSVSATATAIIVALVLGAKERLHHFVRHLDQKEIFAALQFMLIAGVALPLIPNQRMGPYDAINPFEIWLMAVLISGISFFGYIALRALGPRQGILGTAALGGFVSSTAVTVSLARLAREKPEMRLLLSIGILIASTIMFMRVGVIAAIVYPPLLMGLALPIGSVLVISILCVAFMARRSDGLIFEKPVISNPLDIAPAIFFAALLGIIMVSSRALEAVFGSQGVYAISLASGLADVDAITLSLARFATDSLALNVATLGIILAAIANTVVKLLLALFAGGSSLRPAVISLLVIILAAGLTTIMTL